MTFVSTYIGAMEGDDVEANALLGGVLATTREQIVTPDTPSDGPFDRPCGGLR